MAFINNMHFSFTSISWVSFTINAALPMPEIVVRCWWWWRLPNQAGCRSRSREGASGAGSGHNLAESATGQSECRINVWVGHMRGWSRYEQKLTLTSARAKAGVGAWQDQEQEQEQGRRRWAGEGQEHSILILFVFLPISAPMQFSIGRSWTSKGRSRGEQGKSWSWGGAEQELGKEQEQCRSSTGAG